MGFSLDNTHSGSRVSPVNIHIARGDWNDLSFIHKFGYNPTVGTSFETVWDGANVYSYPATAGTVQLTSDDANDNGSTVKVIGLDANYLDAEETLTVGGDRGTQSFSRVFRMFVVNANTGTTNQGVITATHTQADSTDTVVAKIQTGYAQTLMAVYTVPANKRAYLYQLDVGASKDLEHEYRLLTREIDNGNAFQTKTFISGRGGFSEKNYITPIHIPARTDIELQVKSSATSSVSGAFELIVEDKN